MLALIIGFARVWTGVHYPADILAGAVIAAAAVLVVEVGWRLFDRWDHLRRPGAAASGH